jgi:MoxR-like ATPase
MSKLKNCIHSISQVVFGKEREIELSLIAFIAQGHLLIEDQPGVGKTTLALSLSQALGIKFSRVQFTSDMLPSDIIGSQVYEQKQQEFKFHPGPIFTSFLMADELNRTSPKTQSALLQAMEEGAVAVSGQSMPLDENFFVVATQNPQSASGTFSIPGSQLDRFLLSFTMKFPEKNYEISLIKNFVDRKHIEKLERQMTLEDISRLRNLAQKVYVSQKIADYIYSCLSHYRLVYSDSLSPRAGISLARACKARAALHEREFVDFSDVQFLIEPVFSHRLGGDKGVHHGIELFKRELEKLPSAI